MYCRSLTIPDHNECWKSEINVWTWVTELDEKKQALAVALGLEGQVGESAMAIPAEQLDSDNGMTTLLAKLDSVFLKEEKDRAYEAYSHFDSVTEGTIKMMRKTDNLH